MAGEVRSASSGGAAGASPIPYAGGTAELRTADGPENPAATPGRVVWPFPERTRPAPPPGATPMRWATVSPSQLLAGTYATKDDLRAALAITARSLRGKPYVLGDEGKTGYDCSSFVREVYRRSGILLARVSVEQFFSGRPADPFHLRRGDLVFFNTSGTGISHVGMALGDGTFIHAPGTGKTVTITPLAARWYRQRFAGCVDVVGD